MSNEKKIEQLEKLLSFIQNTMTKEEFLAEFKKVLDLFKTEFAKMSKDLDLKPDVSLTGTKKASEDHSVLLAKLI